MSRIVLLLLIVLWMCRTATPRFPAVLDSTQGAGVFLLGLLLIVLFMGLWSRVLSRYVRGGNLHRSLRRYHNSMWLARVMIPVWFAVAVFWLGWGTLVAQMLGPVNRWPMELPGLILGTAPAFIAWMALWWSQYPADRAIREQSQLLLLAEDLPVHRPPGFWSYFVSNLRLQLLFTLAPVGLIILIHDAASLAVWHFASIDLRYADSTGRGVVGIDLVIQLAAIALVVLFVPEILRRVLVTSPLPESPLRRRLEDLCQRTGLRYRDILFWNTGNNMGNAAVMGLIPRMRYILLSDVLLETMTDRQIEAVFAHEIGHVKHWHMGWYVVLVATFVLLFAGPGQFVAEQVDRMPAPTWLRADVLGAVGVIASMSAFFLIFGLLSRWFERQADVFAARTMEHYRLDASDRSGMPDGDSAATIFDSGGWAVLSPAAVATVPRNHVGPRGTDVFTSALHRVAFVNNIPIRARNFTHGSIAERIRYLQHLAGDPARTYLFDRSMSVIYTLLVCAFIACGAWTFVAQAP